MADDDVVYAWPVKSDHGSTTYEVILRRNGDLECPCPGWVFKRKDKPRTCKHVERLTPEAGNILAEIQAGRPVRRPSISIQPDEPTHVRRRPAAIKAADLSSVRRRAIND